MYINNSKPYWFESAELPRIEKHYNAKYIGYWCTKRPDGNWNESPVDVFYVENPDKSKGHSHYFGLFLSQYNELMITNAESAFSEQITGVLANDGEVLVSRYRHDFISKDGAFADGGRDYLRRSAPSTMVDVFVNGSEFTFKVVEDFDV